MADENEEQVTAKEFGNFGESLKEFVKQRQIEKSPTSERFDRSRRIDTLFSSGDRLFSRVGVDYLGFAKTYYGTMTFGGLVAVVVGSWLIGRFRQYDAIKPVRLKGFSLALGVCMCTIGGIAFLTHAAGCFHVFISPTTFVVGKLSSVLIPLIEKLI